MGSVWIVRAGSVEQSSVWRYVSNAQSSRARGSVGTSAATQSPGQLWLVSPASHRPLPQLGTHTPQSAQHVEQSSPGSHRPSPQGTGIVVVVVASGTVVLVSVDDELLVDELLVLEVVSVVDTGLVVVTGVVVVVGVVQPEVPHASQQLGSTLTHPPRAVHTAAVRFVRHFVLPLRVMQQATRPGRPQTDFEAHRATARTHSGRSCPDDARWTATSRAHRT